MFYCQVCLCFLSHTEKMMRPIFLRDLVYVLPQERKKKNITKNVQANFGSVH